MASVKLDENVPDSVGVILREHGHDAALARDEQLTGADDDRILTVASGEHRVLVSLDRDFTNILRHPPEATAGMAEFPQLSLDDIRACLTYAAERDNATVLELG